MLQAANDGCHVVRIISDDSDIFVLLVYWTWRYDLQGHVAVRLDKWDATVLDIATCADLGDAECSQLLGAHALTGCDAVSFPFGKGKAPVVRLLKAGDYSGLCDVLGEEVATDAELVALGQQFFAALYGQRPVASMTQARYNLNTRASGENRCASCHCRLRRRTSCTMCDMPTYRFYSGRRPNILILPMLPSQNTVGK